MATTFSVKRIEGYGGPMTGRGPLKMFFPTAASQTGSPGKLCTIASGVISFTSAHSTTGTKIAGVLEENIPTAKSTNALTLISCATPQSLFEGTKRLTSALTDIGAVHPFVTSTALGGGALALAVMRQTVSSSGFGGLVMAFLGEQIGPFTTGGFIGRADSSVTAGLTNKPLASAKGVVGDTNTRFAFMFPSTCSAWR